MKMKINRSNPVLVDFPDPRANVFLMMRFRETRQQKKIAEAIFSVLKEYSLNLIKADWKHYHDELWTNVRFCMEASQYGIAVFEQIDERDINPNVSLELGYMLSQRKRCLLLKEKRVPALQSDLVGHLYHTFDSYDIHNTVMQEVYCWLQYLGLAKKPDERMLVYVSLGGTCRCAMAKAITQQLFNKNPPPFKLRVESAAHGNPSGVSASYGAHTEIKNLFNKDLLANHRTMKLSKTIIDDANLILVMDSSLLKGLPSDKTRVLKPFLGLKGDILDPWPDERNKAAKNRYARCARELKEILESNVDKIVKALQSM